MILNIINEEFSVCKVADYEGIDLSSPYIFIGSTDEEKSLVCPIRLVPDNTVERDDGEIIESCVISQESRTYGVDIPKNVWHGLECLEPSVLLECKEGPFVEHEIDGILEVKSNE